MDDKAREKIKGLIDSFLFNRYCVMEIKKELKKCGIVLTYDSESDWGIGMHCGLPILAEALKLEPKYCKDCIGEIDKNEKGIKYNKVVFRQTAQAKEIEWK